VLDREIEVVFAPDEEDAGQSLVLHTPPKMPLRLETLNADTQLPQIRVGLLFPPFLNGNSQSKTPTHFFVSPTIKVTVSPL
jgi:hypothetical protein